MSESYGNVAKLGSQYVEEEEPGFAVKEARILRYLLMAFPETAESMIAVPGLLAKTVEGASLSLPDSSARALVMAQAAFAAVLLVSARGSAEAMGGAAKVLTKELCGSVVASAEEADDEGDEGRLAALLRLVVLINLPHTERESNPVMDALVDAESTKAVVEYIPRLLNGNTEVDPLLSEEVILKIVEDFMSQPQSLDLIYPNDIRVVLDVILRELANLEPENPKRVYYLRILSSYFANSDYGQDRNSPPYKIAEIQALLDRIHSEEGDVSEMARLMVETIYSTCETLATWRPTR